MSRVRVYADGFNLYHRALQRTPYKWLDINALAAKLLNPDDEVHCIRYFTARVKPRGLEDDGAGKRQQSYLAALSTLPNCRIHYGRFLNKQIKRPLVKDCGGVGEFVRVHNTEEKGSDVNLATYLIHDGHRDEYDTALVFSQDSDLLEPIRIATRHLGKAVGVVWLDGTRPPKQFVSCATFIRHVENRELSACQFPELIERDDRPPVVKPPGW